MKTVLCAAASMTLLAAAHLSPAIAQALPASGGSPWSGIPPLSDTARRAASSSVSHLKQPPLADQDPEIERLYDEILRRVEVPLAER